MVLSKIKGIKIKMNETLYFRILHAHFLVTSITFSHALTQLEIVKEIFMRVI